MRSAWYLILPLFLGCAGKNTVAGEDKTKGERLGASVPGWCQSTCERIVACGGDDDCSCSGDSCSCTQTNVADCVSACKQQLARFANATDACAAAGERFMSCVDVLKCSQITSGSGNDCSPSAQDKALCPEADDDAPRDNAPPASNSGGTSGIGGNSPGDGDDSGVGRTTGGTASTGPVSCQGSYGTGGSAGTGSTSVVTCEEGRSSCTDAHEYSWLCARGSDGKIGCACFVDGAATGGFDPQTEHCPALSRVNSGCGFALVN